MSTTRPNWIKHCLASACCACAMATAAAETLTLNFDGMAGELYPVSYTEQGFIITSLYEFGPHLHAGGSSLVLHSRDGSSPYHFRRVDGERFDFVGFDYFGGDSLFVSDTGARFFIQGDQPLATFTLSEAFRNVGWVDWYMTNPGDLSLPDPQWGEIDTVVMNVPPVPEPAPAALLGVGLAALLPWARRWHRRPGGGSAA